MTSIQQRDAQTVLAAIDELLPRLRERAPEAEQLRRLPDANVADLDDAGFFKLLQPAIDISRGTYHALTHLQAGVIHEGHGLSLAQHPRRQLPFGEPPQRSQSLIAIQGVVQNEAQGGP